MSRADFNFANNFSENKQFGQNREGFEDIWQTIDDVSSISFEVLIPNKKLTQNEDMDSTAGFQKYFASVEDLLMRQNLVDLAIKENAVVKENKNNPYIDLLVKKEKDVFTKEFAGHLADMTEDDIKFLQLIANNQNVTINNNNSLIVENTAGEKQLEKFDFSKSIMNLIEYAYTSNRPIRIDFAKNLSVIIQISAAGEISAKFIASNKAMEYILKTNIPLLRQKLDKEGIKYKEIYYDEEKDKE